jgi:hypothetical protein
VEGIGRIRKELVLNETDREQGDAREEIARLEARIAALTDAIERCRKISLAARLALALGAVWLVLVLLKVIPFAPIHIIGAISAMLGGIVLFGSNASTWKQTVAAIAAAEARRTELIDGIALRTVADAAEL